MITWKGLSWLSISSKYVWVIYFKTCNNLQSFLFWAVYCFLISYSILLFIFHYFCAWSPFSSFSWYGYLGQESLECSNTFLHLSNNVWGIWVKSHITLTISVYKYKLIYYSCHLYHSNPNPPPNTLVEEKYHSMVIVTSYSF